MQQSDHPLHEYDPSTPAMLEPSEQIRRRDNMPERVVMCFFSDVIRTVCADAGASVIVTLGSEIGPNPVYRLESLAGERIEPVAVLHPGVGAPLAGAFMDEVIALGGSKFIACGGAGVLDHEITMGHLVVPDVAVRDEGTSYHYLPPSREVAVTPSAVEAIKATLDATETPYTVGKTWTTDGIYRETRAKITRRQVEGCITVEMETAAFCAIAQFRDVAFGQILYGGDDLAGDVWDNRDWQRQGSTRERLFWLAVQAVLRM